MAKNLNFRFLLKQLGDDEKLVIEHRLYGIMTFFYNFFQNKFNTATK